MERLILFTIASVLLVTGCTGPTNAQLGQKALSERIALAVTETNKCMDKITSSAAGKVVSSQVLFASPTSKNKFELMTTKSKLSLDQAEALKEYIFTGMECRDTLMPTISGTPLYIVMAQYFDTVDGIYLQLLQSEISIGDANIARDRAFKQREISLQNTSAEMKKVADSQSQQESDTRQQSALRLMNYLQSHRAVNTNCAAIGNSINCVSR